MNGIVYKLLLAGDKFMPEMPDHLLKIQKELHNLNKKEVEDTSIKAN